MRLIFRRSAAALTWAHVESQARRDCEAVVYLACRRRGNALVVEQALPPRRYRDVGPYYAEVDFDEINRIAQQVHPGLEIEARLHSHKFESPHSETDDNSPITGRRGFLSLVISDYASTTDPLRRIAVYEYLGDGQWREWMSSELAGIVIEEDPP